MIDWSKSVIGDEKLNDQSKVIQFDECEYMDERSGNVGSLTNENNALIYTNEDVKENVAVANLEMVEKHKGSGKTHLTKPVDLHCGTCSHKFINTSKLKRHQQMFGHSLWNIPISEL